MPRNMSFAMTIDQFKARTKDVTRRLGWWQLRPDTVIWGVEKAMGLRKGETIQRLGLIKIISTRSEPINRIAQEDVIREGFPDWTPQQFIEMFCEHHQVTPEQPCNRIEFEHIDLYRPSSGTEGDWFMGQFCNQCRKHCETRPCRILGQSLGYDTSDRGYPWQLQRDSEGYITCSAFVERKTPYRPKSTHQRCTMTLDMFPLTVN